MAGGKLVDSSGKETAVDIGEHTLGRGPLLKITDKRVSRTHAILIVEDGSMKICSKHKNPCFHKPANATNFSPIPKDEWKELQPNDQISLLPSDLIFTVVYELPTPERQRSVSPLPATLPVTETVPVADTVPMVTDAVPVVTDTVPIVSDTVPIPADTVPMVTDTVPIPADTVPMVTDTVPIPADTVPAEEANPPNDNERPPQLLTSQPSVGSTGRKRTLPAWLLDCINSNGSSSSSSGESSSRKRPKKSASKTTTSEAGNSSNSTSRKRQRTESKETGRKETSVTEVDKEEDSRDEVASGVSVNTATASASVEEEDGDQEPARAQSSAAKPLPSCPYGKNCYRKNPAHFKEYSHDFDKDDNSDIDDDDNRPECPYGTDCYRKNPAHKQQFKHTAPPPSTAVNKRPKRATRNKKDKRSILAGDSDDDGEVNTYDYNDSFIDDDTAGNSSSSYGGESEDDDWSPGAGGGGGEGGGGSGEEDIDELVADANSFISNKKMQR